MSLINHYSRVSEADVDDSEVSEFNASVGKLLAKARKEAKFSQTKAGNLLGLSQDSVSKHEQGSAVSAYRLKEFSKLYRKPISFFYMGGAASK